MTIEAKVALVTGVGLLVWGLSGYLGFYWGAEDGVVEQSRVPMTIGAALITGGLLFRDRSWNDVSRAAVRTIWVIAPVAEVLSKLTVNVILTE